MTLVEGEHVNALDLAPSATLSVVMRGMGAPVTPPGGELRAEQEWSNTALPGYATRLATVRANLAAGVNSLHQSGQDRTGAAGEAFFVTDAAGNLAINPDLLADNRKVVAGDGTAGDGSVARAISDLGGSTSSILTGYRALVAQVGADRSDNQRESDQAQASRQLIASMQASESGVNLDEELAQMVTIQHAYAASARLLSTYNDMLGTLIERTGT
jgi:flagellar hook-associated protein 1 FlgK